MEILNPGDHWWGILMDGFVGSVLGAIGTIAAVVLTIRHERRERDRAGVEGAVATAHAAVTAHGIAATSDGLPAAKDSQRLMLQALSPALSLTHVHEPELSALMRDASRDLVQATADLDGSPEALDEYTASVGRLNVLLAAWLGTPDLIRFQRVTYETLRAAVDAQDDLGGVPVSYDPITRRERWRRRLTR